MATSAICEFCNKAFKPRGIKLHQKKCSQQRKQLVLRILDTDTFSNVLEFLSNQSRVKLQSITGADYKGKANISSICCPCENDHLAIANGLCLACNKATNPSFRETITTKVAQRLYGIQDIDSIPHTRRSMFRGYYCLFRYEDMQQHVEIIFGSKIAWLEMVVVKISRRKTREKNKTAYESLLATYDPAFVEFMRFHWSQRLDAADLDCCNERYNSIVAALATHNRSIEEDKSYECARYVRSGVGDPTMIASTVNQVCNEKEEREQFIQSLDKRFVKYVGRPSIPSLSQLRIIFDRYEEMRNALVERDLQLRDDSHLCRNYIMWGVGDVASIVDTMEEMNFLFQHTRYARRSRDLSSVEARERLKRGIRDRYVRNSRGLTLPRKWLQ